MKTISPISYFVILIVLCSLTASCKRNLAGFEPLPAERDISLYTRVTNWPDQFEVYPGYFVGDTVGFRVWIGGNEDEIGTPIIELAETIEVDPGDGTGWLDFTQGWKDTFAENGENYSGTHVYQEPGEYLKRLRVTYWDGEVLNYNRPVPITIQPAPDAGE